MKKCRTRTYAASVPLPLKAGEDALIRHLANGTTGCFYERLLSPALSSILQMEERVPRADGGSRFVAVGKQAWAGVLPRKVVL